MASGYTCPVCGQHHAPLPLSFSTKVPWAVGGVPVEERDRRVVILPDLCVIDGRRHFLRGRMLVPIHERPEPFIWGVWAEVAARDFYRAHHRWSVPGREHDEPVAGHLASEIPFYARTLGVALRIQMQPVGQRPHFLIAQEEHPLGVEQRAGLSLAQIIERAACVRHGKLR